MIALLVITDGREHIFETVPSALANLVGPITTRLIYDDSDNDAHFDRLANEFAPLGFDVIGGVRRGFGGAIRYCWSFLADHEERFVFHLEDDFIFNRAVDLRSMAMVLDAHPHLAQLALRRQPWNDDERSAGGIVEQHPDDYREWNSTIGDWLEHRRFFTTNPSLYRRSLCERGWPEVEHSEGVFTHQLLADPDVRFGFWGRRDDTPWVTHIGHERVGIGY